MAMNVSGGGAGEPMCDVNTTPLIDVMLVLLTMLILTLPVQNHAVKLEMPPPSNVPQQPQEPPVTINIEIDPDGTIVVDGAAFSSLNQLEQYFRTKSADVPQPEIHLRPSGLAMYDVVANVMAAAQRQNMLRMGFTNVAEFAE